LLLVKTGPTAGTQYIFEAPVTKVGRHPDSDIFLDDVTVSRRHAELVREGARYFVRDVGSPNGTYVNRTRVEKRRLSSGDEVQIGKFKLVYVATATQKRTSAGRKRREPARSATRPVLAELCQIV
jgi:pSer/pThr/pTyr-binding forkhead associated (FHA) protein